MFRWKIPTNEDVRQIVNVQDTSLFQRFLGLCAGNIGQLLNASRIGNDCGLNHDTVSKWFSILENSYVAFRLTPHHRNFRKRLVKTPKLYFWDTVEKDEADQLAARLARSGDAFVLHAETITADGTQFAYELAR